MNLLKGVSHIHEIFKFQLCLLTICQQFSPALVEHMEDIIIFLNLFSFS